MTPGLYDGFEGYITASAEDFGRVLAEGLVVADANVLLNLYRYTSDARNDLLTVMTRLGERLWIPHQVVEEFWRNRTSVLRDPRSTDETAEALARALETTTQSFRTWANRVSLPGDRAEELIGQLTSAFESVIGGVRQFEDTTAADWARDTAKDTVLSALGTIIEGRVGAPLEAGDHDQAVKEGLRRVAERLPPGYKDKKKDEDGAAGDYLVWEQVLREAEARDCDVLFVTGDVKEDWWRQERGENRGPRLELAAEMRKRCGRRLLMMRPAQLLTLGRDRLDVVVRDESVEDADRVERLLLEADAALVDGGWTHEAVERLLELLRSEATVQCAAIEEAAAGDGFVSRERVYELGGYPKNRSLRGFTRPINRLSRSFRHEGRIAREAVDPIWTVYDEDAPNINLALGFRLRDEVLPLFAAAVDAAD